MTDQRNPHSTTGRARRTGRAESWGMLPLLFGVVALLLVGFIIFGTSPEAPNTTRSSEYQQNRPVTPAPSTTPTPTPPNPN
jgi:hypothetical protein